MQPALVLLKKLHHYVQKNDLLAIIDIIQSTLEPLQQKEQLKIALKLLHTGNNRETLLHYACKMKSKALRELLVSNNLIAAKDLARVKETNNENILTYFVGQGDIEGVKHFLKQNTSPLNENLLTIAGQNFDIDMMKFLIQHIDVSKYGAKAIIEIFDTNGLARYNQQNASIILNILILNGANVLAPHERGYLKFENILQLWDKGYVQFAKTDFDLVEKETKSRKMLNTTIPLLFWATKKDKNCNFYGLPEEITKKIAATARNQTF